MKERTWLCRKITKTTWAYGLARYSDGTIRVSEILGQDLFTPVGARSTGEGDYGSTPYRLRSGERSLIVADLFVACSEELGISIPPSAIEMLYALRVKALKIKKEATA